MSKYIIESTGAPYSGNVVERAGSFYTTRSGTYEGDSKRVILNPHGRNSYGNGMNGGNQTQSNLRTGAGQFTNRRTGRRVRGNQPYHTHQGQAMAGARHVSTPHDYYDPLMSTPYDYIEHTDREDRVTGDSMTRPPDSGRRLTGGRSECNIGEVELWGVCYDPATTTSINRDNEDFGGAGNGDNPIPVSGPNSILYLQNLESIHISRCNITGPIPHQLGQLPNLKHISLYGPSGPSHFQNWDMTNYVGLTGTIPDSLTNLTNLETLHIWEWPGIHGTIPLGLQELPYLYSLNLCQNCLNGEIPSGLLNKPTLRNLSLGYNGFSNAPGQHVCNQLGTGGLTGAPFSSVPTMQNSGLRSLNLSRNKLTGNIEKIVEAPDLHTARLCCQGLNNLDPGFGGFLSDDFCNFFTRFECYEPDCEAYTNEGNWIQNAPYLSIGGNNICPPFPQCVAEQWGHSTSWNQGQCMYDTGDVNQDGFVDILDVVTTIQYILGDVTFNEVQMHFADFNQDGQINITDVVGMIQHIAYNYSVSQRQRTELMNLLNQVQSGNLRGALNSSPLTGTPYQQPAVSGIGRYNNRTRQSMNNNGQGTPFRRAGRRRPTRNSTARTTRGTKMNGTTSMNMNNNGQVSPNRRRGHKRKRPIRPKRYGY